MRSSASMARSAPWASLRSARSASSSASAPSRIAPPADARTGGSGAIVASTRRTRSSTAGIPSRRDRSRGDASGSPARGDAGRRVEPVRPGGDVPRARGARPRSARTAARGLRRRRGPSGAPARRPGERTSSSTASHRASISTGSVDGPRERVAQGARAERASGCGRAGRRGSARSSRRTTRRARASRSRRRPGPCARRIGAARALRRAPLRRAAARSRRRARPPRPRRSPRWRLDAARTRRAAPRTTPSAAGSPTCPGGSGAATPSGRRISRGRKSASASREPLRRGSHPRRIAPSRGRGTPPPTARSAGHERREVGRRARHERLGIEDRARGDDPGDVAPDEPLRGPRVLHLVAHRDLAAGGDELRDVVLDAVVRHAAHRRLDVRVAVAGGQRDAEDGRRLLRVVEEHLVEVAHPVEEDGVRRPALHLEVLPQHRGGARRPAGGAQLRDIIARERGPVRRNPDSARSHVPRARGTAGPAPLRISLGSGAIHSSDARHAHAILALDTASPSPAVTRSCPAAARDVRDPLPAIARRPSASSRRSSRASPSAGVALADCGRIAVCSGPGLLHGRARRARHRVGPRPRARVSRRAGADARGDRGGGAVSGVVAGRGGARRRPRRDRLAAVRPRRRPRARPRRPASRGRRRPKRPGARPPALPFAATLPRDAACRLPVGLARDPLLDGRWRRSAVARRAGRGAPFAVRHLLAAERRRGKTWRSVSRARRTTRSSPRAPRTSTRSRGSRRESFLVPWKREFFATELDGAVPLRARARRRTGEPRPAGRRIPLRRLSLRRVPHQQDRDRPDAAPPGLRTPAARGRARARHAASAPPR